MSEFFEKILRIAFFIKTWKFSFLEDIKLTVVIKQLDKSKKFSFFYAKVCEKILFVSYVYFSKTFFYIFLNQGSVIIGIFEIDYYPKK